MLWRPDLYCNWKLRELEAKGERPRVLWALTVWPLHFPLDGGQLVWNGSFLAWDEGGQQQQLINYFFYTLFNKCQNVWQKKL